MNRWEPNHVDTNIGLTVGSGTEVEFLVGDHNPNGMILVIGDSLLEISFESSTVELLRDKADAALGELRARRAARRREAGLVGACERPDG